MKGLLPDSFIEMFIRNNNVSVQNTRQSNYLRTPSCRTAMIQKTVRYKGVIGWNSIVKKLDNFCSLHSFKRRLKHYLLQNLLQND